MLPDSDNLEDYHQRLVAVLARLAKLKNSQSIPLDVVSTLAELAKDWLRQSSAFHSLGLFDKDTLEHYDGLMKAILTSTGQQSRASAYVKKLQPITTSFVDSIIIPIIKAEGNPSQIAARQLKAIFAPYITSDEVAYVEEAANCMILECHRAAIIMLWAAAVARFHAAIVNLGFNTFNSALIKTQSKKQRPFSNVSTGQISSIGELQLARDFDIIVVGMELWKYDMQTFEELARLLGTRNNAAHPGMYHPNASDVQHFATKLESYVFQLIRP